MKTQELHFTVIVPTYKDWAGLQLCVDQLDQLDYPRQAFEVIIVDNEVVHQVPSDLRLPADFVLIHQPISGSYAARNLALERARGKYLAFTDSDCLVDRNWLKNAWNCFERTGTDRIAGKVEIFYENPQKKTATELYESVFAFDQEKNVSLYKASITANLITRTDAFEKVGPFDARKKSGEDFGWNWRANEKGLSLCYADDVLVKHPARKNLEEIARKKRRVFGGKKKFDFKSPKGILKELIYVPYLFKVIVIGSFRRLNRSKLSLFEKIRVQGVILHIYLVTVGEYFRLAFGGEPIR